MKKVLCSCLVLAICLSCGCARLRLCKKEAPGETELVLIYRDIVAGEDARPRYETKFKVFIDGELAGESDAAKRFEKKTLRVAVEPGPHAVIVEGYALKDGVWEKRTKAKGYSADHRLEKEIEISPGEQMIVNFIVPDRAKHLKIRL
ncbi:MAG: hypothetical protein P9M00_13680 [Candidatus Tritonobacter lacicola]|nr:hypothetical protein [Candidatus Tritonobacter lacicola]